MRSILPANVTGLTCLHCGNEQQFSFPVYRCHCGGNLSVAYDLVAIAAGFKRPSLQQLAAQGHFAYRDLLPLAGDAWTRFQLPVGGSPLIQRQDLAAEAGVASLHFKDDTRLPSSSFKDRASSVTLAMALERDIDRVCTASTGNAGCSMACLCADSGLEAIVFVPETAPKAKVAQLLFYGATVIKVRGNYDQAFDLCWDISVRRGWLNRSTGWNPFTREGKKTVSFEIAQQLDWQSPDLVFVPVGDGNIISGVWKGFKELYDIGAIEQYPKIIAVQSTHSNAVSLAVDRVREGMNPVEAVQPVAATTLADSIAVDLPRDGVAAVGAVLGSGGTAVQVSDQEILQAVVSLSSRAGIFAEPAGATAYAGLIKWAETHGNLHGLRAVCLVTGNGLKDVAAATAYAGQPLLVEPDADATEAALLEIVERRTT